MTTMPTADLGDEDDGFLRVTMLGVSLPIDVWKANNRIADYHAANKEKAGDLYMDGLARLVEGFGFPPMSHRLADRFVAAIKERMEALRGKA